VTDLLYARDVLRLAAEAAGAGRASPCDAEGDAHNPVCGDRVSVTLAFDAEGRIADLGHVTQACVLAQASASILGRHLPGSPRESVARLREDVATMLQGGAPPSGAFAA
jgi:nitrogen fixation protein NifU and related proteins